MGLLATSVVLLQVLAQSPEELDAGEVAVGDAGLPSRVEEVPVAPTAPPVASLDPAGSGAADTAQVSARVSQLATANERGALGLGHNLWLEVERPVGAFVAGVHLSANLSQGLTTSDDGSFLFGAWRPDVGSELRVALHPFSTRRLRLGVLEPIRFPLFLARSGGTTAAGTAAQDASALELSGSFRGFTAFAWIRFGEVLNDLTLENDLRASLFTGLGYRRAGFSAALTAMQFDHGPIPALAVQGQDVRAYSQALHLSARFDHGGVVPAPVDFTWEAANADRWTVFFPDEPTDRSGRALNVVAEGAYLMNALENPNVFATLRGNQSVVGGLAVLGRLGGWHAHLRGTARTLPFIQLTGPGFPPYRDFPDGTTLTNEEALRLGGEYAFGPAWPRVGLGFSYTRPASFTSPSTLIGGNNPPGGAQSTRVVVVRDTNVFSILPTGATPSPVLQLRATLSWQPAPLLGIAAEAAFERDPNRVTFRDDVTGVAQPSLEDPDSFTVRTLLQLRF